jgi:hypothetical protein
MWNGLSERLRQDLVKKGLMAIFDVGLERGLLPNRETFWRRCSRFAPRLCWSAAKRSSAKKKTGEACGFPGKSEKLRTKS